RTFPPKTGTRFWRSYARPSLACPFTGHALTESQRKNVADDILFLLFCQEVAKDGHPVAAFVNPLEDGCVVCVLSTGQHSRLRALERWTNPEFLGIGTVTYAALGFEKLLA